VERRDVSGVMTAKTARKPELYGSGLSLYEYNGTEHFNGAGWEEEDYYSLGFSNSIYRCRCLRGYCEGRNSDCIRDPGITARLMKQAVVLLSRDLREPPSSFDELSSCNEPHCSKLQGINKLNNHTREEEYQAWASI
jgi:hypothetical protein